MNTKQGMAVSLMIAIAAGVIVLGGVALFNMQPEEKMMMKEGEAMMEEGEKKMTEGEAMMKEGEAMMEKAENMTHEGEAMMEKGEKKMTEGESMMEKDDVVMKEGETSMTHGDEEPIVGMFSGDRLAGSPEIPLLEYNDEDYQAALASDKLIALFFYANWCPSCRVEFPRMEQAFDGFTDENVVGFRVNFKDNATSDSERDLAREHGVGYQHTKVFIKDGERVLKSPETWSTEKYVSEITSNL